MASNGPPRGRPPRLDVTDADVDEQAPLPTTGGLERPQRDRDAVRCPRDDTDVTGSLKAYHVDGAHLDDHKLDDVEQTPVYGYRCPYCSTVLPVDPADPTVDAPGPGTGRDGWLAVRAEFDDDHGHVLVPWGVITA